MNTHAIPAAVVAEAQEHLPGVAESAADADAEAHLHNSAPQPTSGEARLVAEWHTFTRAFDLACHNALAAISAGLAERARVLANYAATGRVPRALRHGEQFPKEWALMIALGLVEAVTFHNPARAVLDLASNPAWLVAGSAAVFAAVFAEFFGKYAVRASDSSGGRRDRALGMRALFLALLCLVAVVVVVARITSARLDAVAGLNSALDASGIAFFIGFQAMFVAVNAVLGSHHHRRLADEGADAIEAIGNEHAEGEQRLLQAPEEHARLRELLDGWFCWALLTYRVRLAANHPDPESEIGWQDRTAAELASGELFSIFPGIVVPAAARPAGVAAGEPAADEAAAEPLDLTDDARGPDNAEVRDQHADDVEEADGTFVVPPADDAVGDVDLLAAILDEDAA